MPPTQDGQVSPGMFAVLIADRSFKNFVIVWTVLLACGAVGMTILYCIELKKTIDLFKAMSDIRNSMIKSNEASKTMSDPQILTEARRLAIRLFKENKQYYEVYRELQDVQQKKRGGWIAYRGYLYYFSSLMLFYDKAEMVCEKNNSKLVYITSAAEETFLEKVVIGTKASHWIGLYKIQSRWTWSNGAPLTTAYWKTGSPGAKKDSSAICAEIIPCGTVTQKCWEDNLCDVSRNFICKKVPVSNLLP